MSPLLCEPEPPEPEAGQQEENPQQRERVAPPIPRGLGGRVAPPEPAEPGR